MKQLFSFFCVYLACPWVWGQYKDCFATADGQIRAVTAQGNVHIFVWTEDTCYYKRDFKNANCLTMTSDLRGRWVWATKTHVHLPHQKIRYKARLFQILFDSHNRPFLLTKYGVKTARKPYYFPDKTIHNNPLTRGLTDRWPTGNLTAIMDKEDRMWIGVDYGEFGRDLYLFDTKTMQYQPTTKEVGNFLANGFKGFVQSAGVIYAYTSLAHGGDSSASIVCWRDGTIDKLCHIPKETISTLQINPYDSCCYYSNSKGLYKQDSPHVWAFSLISSDSSIQNAKKMLFLAPHTWLFLAKDGHLYFWAMMRIRKIAPPHKAELYKKSIWKLLRYAINTHYIVNFICFSPSQKVILGGRKAVLSFSTNKIMNWTENKWLKPAWMSGGNDFVTKYQDKFAQIGEKFAPKIVEKHLHQEKRKDGKESRIALTGAKANVLGFIKVLNDISQNIVYYSNGGYLEMLIEDYMDYKVFDDFMYTFIYGEIGESYPDNETIVLRIEKQITAVFDSFSSGKVCLNDLQNTKDHKDSKLRNGYRIFRAVSIIHFIEERLN